MSAYETILEMIRLYFIDLGYNKKFINIYFSNIKFSELVSIRLANANIVIKNKTDRTSHQTHIAITGEAINFFYSQNDFFKMDNKIINKEKISVSDANIQQLYNEKVQIKDDMIISLTEGFVTIGKRTQNQVQLSKKNSENSQCFNSLRNGLYENDLLILLKYREEKSILAIGIPKAYYLSYIPNYFDKYETNTYLRIPNVKL